MDDFLAGLDVEQRQVATTFGSPVAVIAGAGTGKTRAITHRIAYGVVCGAYDPSGVLAVTFTTKAAGEMRVRLRDLGFGQVQARTFHSAALRQAQYFWPKITGKQLPSVSERTLSLVAEAARGLGLRLDKGGLRDAANEISWAKVSNVLTADYVEVATDLGRSFETLTPHEIARIAQTYENLKIERQIMDFDDILLLTVGLLADNPQVLSEVRRTYRHLIVDEFQDVSPLQYRLLTLWVGEGSDLCVVGDPAQTIHSFAGASADYLTGFLKRYPQAVTLRLVRNYRSTPEIIAMANSVATGMGSVRLVPARDSGPKPELRETASSRAEAELIAQWLRARHEAGTPWSEMAILYRINAQAPAIESALLESGVPYSVRDDAGFFERSEIRQMIYLISRLDPTDPADIAEEVFSELGFTEIAPAGGGSQRERWESLSALRAMIVDFIDRGVRLTVADLLAELNFRQGVSHIPSADAVTMSTIHSAKGLEWEAVAVSNVQEGSLPYVLATSAADLAEERRLLYVAITRAKSQLLLTWSSGRNGNRRCSRFLNHIKPTGPKPNKPVSRSSALGKTCRVCGEVLDTPAARKLGRHMDCPAAYNEATWAALRSWRLAVAKAESFPAFVVFTDATLMAIAEARPKTKQELRKISGVGPTKVETYGPDILRILAEYSDIEGAATSVEKLID